jgi:topoisomerase-4 subunit A
VTTREEYVVSVTVLPADAGLTLYAGKRHITLKAADLEHYEGERGRRGNQLPRGFQRVDSMGVEQK